MQKAAETHSSIDDVSLELLRAVRGGGVVEMPWDKPGPARDAKIREMHPALFGPYIP